MLIRPQILTFALVCNRLNAGKAETDTSRFPHHLVKIISNIGFDENSDLAELLKFIASTPQTLKVQALLEKDPTLLLQAGNVKTESGDDFYCMTPYEAALATGNHYQDKNGLQMITLVVSYFAKLPDGEKERLRQLAHFSRQIKSMNKTVTYNFDTLVYKVMSSSDEDVVRALAKDFVPGNPLHDELTGYRLDCAPRKITRSMQFNLRNLLSVLNCLENMFDPAASEEMLNKYRLIWRQIFAFMLRRLAGCDRRAFMTGLYEIAQKNALLKCILNDNDYHCFPPTPSDEVQQGIGYDEAVTTRALKTGVVYASSGYMTAPLKKIIEKKHSFLFSHVRQAERQTEMSETAKNSF